MHRHGVGVLRRATLGDVRQITHRQMRNDSAEVLRRVAEGESLVITNNGQPAAVIGPPEGDTLALLRNQGRLRPALESPAVLMTIERRRATRPTVDLLADARGRW